MSKLKDLQENIQKIITECKDEVLVQKLGQSIALIDQAETEYNELEKRHVDLVSNYGKLVIQVSSKATPEDEVKKETPMTLNEVIESVIHKGDKK